MVMYPDGGLTNPNSCCSSASPWAYANYESLGQFMANLLSTHFGEGGSTGEPRPRHIEVVNEPPLWNLSPYNTTNENIFTMHKIVADSIHALHPDINVGGFTAAAPSFEDDDFQNWEEEWKTFIDITDESMDFYSLHIYDFHPNGELIDNLERRSGSNTEAVLDMIEHYSILKFGRVKPLLISEYGYWSPGLDGTSYSKERDWANLRSFSTQMMQFMERPHSMLKTIPFMILKANWWSHSSGEKYPYRLLRQNNEVEGETGSQWVYTELLKFFELWKDVDGLRIESRASDLDIQTDAFVNGREAFLVINNLNLADEEVHLNIIEDSDNVIEKIDLLHLREVNGLPTLESTEFATIPSKLTIAREATMVLKFSYADSIIVDQSYEEEKIYADKYLQAISANQEQIFQLQGITTSVFGEATLRLGIGRNHGKSLSPRVEFNGIEIPVSDDWRGYDQLNRDRFFGLLEIPIPYELVESENTVSITFPDTGGHISSLSLQNFRASEALTRTTISNTSDLPTSKSSFDFSVSPNPTSGYLLIELSQEVDDARISLKTMDGRVIKQFDIQGREFPINLEDAAKGIYIISIEEGATVVSKKVLID